MTTKKLTEEFLIWFQKNYPDARIYRNNTGIAWKEDKNGKKYPVKFGIPLPQGKGKGGGGNDWISFHPLIKIHPVCIAKFWEIKLKKDTIKENQKIWYRQAKKLYAKVYIVKEIDNDQWIIEEWQE